MFQQGQVFALTSRGRDGECTGGLDANDRVCVAPVIA
jgi:hypothetical protein